jgi:hypothetical protein
MWQYTQALHSTAALQSVPIEMFAVFWPCQLGKYAGRVRLLFEFVYIFILTQIARILCIIYVHCNMFLRILFSSLGRCTAYIKENVYHIETSHLQTLDNITNIKIIFSINGILK